MRAPVIILLLAAPVSAHIGAPPPEQHPEQVTLRLSSDASVTFDLSNGRATRIRFNVGRVDTEMLLDDCSQLVNIRFDTAVLHRYDLDKTNGTNGFALFFKAEVFDAQRFGDVRRVQISVDDGKVSAALIASKPGESNALPIQLCSRAPV